jgi:methionyl-tRNA synthetase
VKDTVSFTDFAKLDLQVGEILSVTEVPGSDKLLELRVRFDEETGERTIFAGIKKWYAPEAVVGKKLIFVVNLAPKTFKIFDKEYTSEGMLMAAGKDEAVLYTFDKNLAPGTNVH